MRRLARYWWVVDLGLLAGLAALAALAINNRIGAEIHALPSAPTVAEPVPLAPDDRDAPDRWATAITERNLFNSDPPEPEPPAPPEPEPDPQPTADDLPGPAGPCDQADGTLKLVATMVAEPAAASRAVLADGRGRNAERRLVRPGSRLEDGVVAAIYRQRAVLWQTDAFACLELGEEPPRRRASRRATPRTSRRKTGFDPDSVKSLGKNRYAIDRAALDEQLGDLGKLGRQIRIRPHSRGGQNLGFKILRVSRNSLFDAIGLERNDILSSVNGEPLDSPTKALQLFEQLEKTRNVTVEVKRRGKPVVLEYQIR